MKQCDSCLHSLRTKNDNSVVCCNSCMGCGIVVHCIYAYSAFVHNCLSKKLALVLDIWSFFSAAGIRSPWCLKMSAWQTGASLDFHSSAANSLYHRGCCRVSKGGVQTGNCSWGDRNLSLLERRVLLQKTELFSNVQLCVDVHQLILLAIMEKGVRNKEQPRCCTYFSMYKQVFL